MSSLEEPWYAPMVHAFLMEDVPRLMGYSPSAHVRDCLTLSRRLAKEGESFLTKTLPAFGKEIDRALAGTHPLTTRLFAKKSKRDARPRFLWALLRCVFQPNGELADNPSLQAIRLIRQMCLWMKKLEKGYSDESLQRALLDFVEVDRALPVRDDLPRTRTLATAKAIITAVVGRRPPKVDLKPRHGPGAVAEVGLGVGKRSLRRKYSKLMSVFRPIPYFWSLRDASEAPERIFGGISCEYGLSRTEFVPKDSGGPRTIGLEPAEYMWCQQALKGWLYHHVESCRLTKGHVNFTDQSINQRLTAEWSMYDTLDMSKASDRNSLALVEALFHNTWIWPYLEASRTPGTVLPNGEVLIYRKFAPMGSAVCFPVQALVYFALACAILHEQGMPLRICTERVFVYGDDLVVPHGYFDSINSGFETFGLKFNLDKCCVAGKFRESCGVDAYDGFNVTPIRLKRAYPKHGRQDLIPLVKHANNLWRAGYCSAAYEMRRLVELRGKLLNYPTLPTSDRDDLPILYWLDYTSTVKYSYSNSLCYVRGWVFVPDKDKGRSADEMKYLRESLLHGGAVGHLLPSSTRRPGSWCRTFDRRYTGTMKKKRFVILPRPADTVTSRCLDQK